MKSARKMTIQEATASYEEWLGEQIPLVPEDLERKHELMRSGPFPFLRATYYRWTQLWELAPKPVRNARQVLAVGDLHVENFGTWRDAEGRLVWGINDFDEAGRLPYTYDLVRLAASARLAIADGKLQIESKEADAAILAGYREGLEAGGRPFILAERRRALRRIAMARQDQPDKFWEKLEGLPAVAADRVPASAARALGVLLPMEGLPLRYFHRVAGVGSLGRQRFVAIADWCGGKIAREAKAAARSAFLWSHRGLGETKELYREILGKAVRCRDPFIAVRRRWIARRFAPDCTRVDLAELEKEQEANRLLHAMGWETANVHLGSATAAALLVDLASQSEGWLHEAVEEMSVAVHADWSSWKKAPGVKSRKAASSPKLLG
ncbi:MAG TPA: DUF2252 family protein [Thermoanaerobaculia bacterium]|jgi:hypothetical protein|nr:DUF2252 family protein [Thermoanaerobaculia bacterium]